MKRTLLICTHYPLPEHSGMNMRTMNFVRFFKDHGDVDIAYSHILTGSGIKSGLFSQEYFLKQDATKSFHDRLIRWADIKRRPFPVAKYSSAAERRLLKSIESCDYDYIVVRYIYNTSCLFTLPDRYRKRVIIDFDDILSGSLYESKIGSANGLLRKFRLRLNHTFLKTYEKKCLDFSAAIFCSEVDKLRVLGQNGRKNSFVVPNVYHNESFETYAFGDGFQNRNVLLFVGTLNYEPNASGLMWFIESIFPFFKQEFPDAILMIVGNCSSQILADRFKSYPAVELHTNVSDLRGYYKECRAVIVPLLAGGGTRIKILEAALAGRPVLSTPTGAEGLELIDNRDLLLFHNASDFIRQYQNILNKETYLSLTNNAKRIVTSQYSMENFNSIMQKIINDRAQ
jgi:polysaccharide biosynthesis protein PslH